MNVTRLILLSFSSCCICRFQNSFVDPCFDVLTLDFESLRRTNRSLGCGVSSVSMVFKQWLGALCHACVREKWRPPLWHGTNTYSFSKNKAIYAFKKIRPPCQKEFFYLPVPCGDTGCPLVWQYEAWTLVGGWRTFLYHQQQPLPGETRENGQKNITCMVFKYRTDTTRREHEQSEAPPGPPATNIFLPCFLSSPPSSA